MKVNRAYYWTENFFERLSDFGVKYICISPGSRSTSLTFAAAANKRFKCFVNIDERNSAFFALGLVKATGKPVVIITTSGTATAELYPAIIEAYYQRVPLIVCTADRPPELLGKGANQTINQENIFKNHIRFYRNAGLPAATFYGIKKIRKFAEEAYINSSQGPVHINFPFRKPFEPGAFTDKLNSHTLNSIRILKSKERIVLSKYKAPDKNLFNEILTILKTARRGLIIAGPMKYDKSEKTKILELAERLNYPVIADACSQLRFGNKSEKVITGYEIFLRDNRFIKSNSPGIILQFGSTPSSRAIEIYLEKSDAKRYIINHYGDIFDPLNKAAGTFKCSPSLFCEMIIKDLPGEKGKKTNSHLTNNFRNAEILAHKTRENIINLSAFPNECRIIAGIIDSIPENTHIMVSNSMPVRDFDYFAQRTSKNIIIHSNRGASGIDGILSTSLGISKAVSQPVLLITGDMAFYYDLTALLTAKKYKIPLVVILINNNGGGIFGMLPVSKYGRIYKEYFVCPHNLDFSTIIKGFGGKHRLIRSWKDLTLSLRKALDEKQFTVLEIRTDIKTSVALRKKYIKTAKKF